MFWSSLTLNNPTCPLWSNGPNTGAAPKCLLCIQSMMLPLVHRQQQTDQPAADYDEVGSQNTVTHILLRFSGIKPLNDYTLYSILFCLIIFTSVCCLSFTCSLRPEAACFKQVSDISLSHHCSCFLINVLIFLSSCPWPLWGQKQNSFQGPSSLTPEPNHLLLPYRPDTSVTTAIFSLNSFSEYISLNHLSQISFNTFLNLNTIPWPGWVLTE